MKNIITILLFLTNFMVFGQATLDFCGTKQGRSTWLKSFQLRSESEKNQYRSGEVIWVPLSIHILTKDDGKGGFRNNNLVKALCNLNDVFLTSDIQFYILGDIHFEASTAMWDHSTTNAGGEFMLEHNIPNSLNCYVVKGPAGNCGYNLPWAGIALGTACMKTFDLTWAHEIGHALSLPHPFLGWEGGQSYDGSIPANYNNPAPSFVTYDYTDFKEIQHHDTLIIDTSYVELIDGSNCHVAADGFCDTKPDYIAARWSCNAEGLSKFEQVDPNGVVFRSQGDVLMGYSSATNKESNVCRGIFTTEQGQAMRANLIEEKSDWLNQTYELDGIANEIINPFPTDGDQIDYQNIEFSWENTAGNADKYLVQIGIENTLTLVLFDSIVSEQNMQVFDLEVGKKYYWRVRAIDNNEFCSDFSEINAFESEDLSATSNLSVGICTVFPNIIKTNQPIHIGFATTTNYNYQLFNRNGQKVSFKNNSIEETINTKGLVSGFYFLNINTSEGNESFKIQID